MTRTPLVPLLALATVLAGGTALAAPIHLAKAPALTACDDPSAPPPRFIAPGPFYGDWDVTTGDGTKFSINIRQVTGAIANHVTVTYDSSPPPPIKFLGGYTMNKNYVHFTLSVSGQKGDMVLTLAPDGNGFAGAGHLADGTALSWTATKSQPATTGQTPTDTGATAPQSDQPGPVPDSPPPTPQ